MTPTRDRANSPLVIVKLGGSVLTRKSTLGGIRHENLVRLARELADVAREARLVIVHGGGSVGHPLARLYHIYGRGEDRPNSHADAAWRSEGASMIQRSMLRLNAALVGALMESGVPALSVPGGIVAELTSGELSDFHPGAIQRYLATGCVPVAFGDVAPDHERGLAIVSGDTLVLGLARALKPNLVVFATDQDGLFDHDPRKVTDARMITELDESGLDALAARLAAEAAPGNGDAERKQAPDATGGMLLKVQELAEIVGSGTPAFVISGLEPGRVAAAVRGGPVIGTRLVPHLERRATRAQ